MLSKDGESIRNSPRFRPMKSRGFSTQLFLYRGLLLAGAVSGVLLFAALQPTPPPPLCRVSPQHAETPHGNAGCLIRLDGRMLMVRDRRSGKLGFPAGMGHPGEAAQCTAHRETWEEAGIDAEVGRLIRVFENGFRLYACLPADPSIRPGVEVGVPEWAWAEVSAIDWIDPESVFAEDWRYPEQWQSVLEKFRELGGDVQKSTRHSL